MCCARKWKDNLFQGLHQRQRARCCTQSVLQEDTNHLLVQTWSVGTGCAEATVGIWRVGCISLSSSERRSDGKQGRNDAVAHLNWGMLCLVDWGPKQPQASFWSRQCKFYCRTTVAANTWSYSREVSPPCSFTKSVMLWKCQYCWGKQRENEECACWPNWSSKRSGVWCCICTSAVSAHISGGTVAALLPSVLLVAVQFYHSIAGPVVCWHPSAAFVRCIM